MPLFGSIVTHLILAVTLVLAAAVAGIMAFHYAKARLREKRGYAFDPVVEEAPPPGGVEQRAKSAEEITEIRARIEALMEHQHIRSETENQHLAQKLDEIRTHMSTQDRKVDGLKSELRHEIHRRNGELDELRHQLASALDAFWKSMPALPEAAAAPRALPPAQATPADAAPSLPDPLPIPSAEEPPVATVPVEMVAQEDAEHAAAPAALAGPPSPWSPSHAEVLPDEVPLAEVPLEDEPAEAPRPPVLSDPEPAERGTSVSYGDESPVEEATFVEVRFEEDPYAGAPSEEALPDEAPVAPDATTPLAARSVEAAAPPPPTSEPRATLAPPPPSALEPPTPPSWSAPFASGDGAAPGEGVPADPPTASHAPARPTHEAPAAPPASARPEPPVAAAAPAAEAPVEGDDLTVVSSITPEIQQALYAAGVTSLEGIARWSRADARRISGLVGVPEEVIMHQWIFEAQSVLFEQYQALMTQQA